MKKLSMIWSQYTFKLFQILKKIGFQAQIIQTVCIYNQFCILRQHYYKFCKEILQVSSSTQPWANYPAVYPIKFALKIFHPLTCELLKLFRIQQFVRIIIENRMNNKFRRITFNWNCGILRTEYMSQVSPHFKRSHSRIKRSSCVLETSSDYSDKSIASFNTLICQRGQRFQKLLQSYHFNQQQICKIKNSHNNYRLLLQQQIILMKKSSEKDNVLPLITTSSYRSTQRPMKDILKDLKQRKQLIKQRIKTQLQQSESQDVNQNQSRVRQRIITQVPYYINRSTFHNRVGESLKQFEKPKEIKVNKTVQDQPEQIQLAKSQKKKRDSILQPIPDHQSSHEINEPVQHEHIQLPAKTQKQITNQIQQLLLDVPVDPRDRTEGNIQNFKNYLMENNMFFAKLNNMIVTCLLKLNRIVWIQRHQLLYKIGQERNCMYVILCGRIKLYNAQKNLKKICTGGETLGEQLLFANKLKKTVLQSAKAISKCFLLQIKVQNHKKMNEQMVKYGYKLVFNEMQSIIKRNFITKNWLRSQKTRIQKKK